MKPFSTAHRAVALARYAENIENTHDGVQAKLRSRRSPLRRDW